MVKMFEENVHVLSSCHNLIYNLFALNDRPEVMPQCFVSSLSFLSKRKKGEGRSKGVYLIMAQVNSLKALITVYPLQQLEMFSSVGSVCGSSFFQVVIQTLEGDVCVSVCLCVCVLDYLYLGV